MGWRCFGASDHGPVSFRRVGQSVDLPDKARRWGHDLRGSPQSGCLKPWSRPPQRQRVSSPSCPQLASAPPGAASRGADRRQAAPQRRRAPAPCAGLDEAGKFLPHPDRNGYQERRDVAAQPCIDLRQCADRSVLPTQWPTYGPRTTSRAGHPAVRFRRQSGPDTGRRAGLSQTLRPLREALSTPERSRRSEPEAFG